MASIPTNLTPATLHSDLRAPSIGSLRAHAQAEKWKHTTTTLPAHWTATAPISTPIPRPQKQARLTRAAIPSPRGTALSHAWDECRDRSSARGDGETEALDDGVGMPPGVPVGDEAIFYTFDSEASPASSVGLDGLVDRAERHFRERETERIVRAEYEVLDGEGERVRRRRGKGSVGEVEEERVVEGEVGGAWEAI